MQKLLLIIIISILNFLLFQSQACLTSNKKALLNFSYYLESSNRPEQLSITAYFAPKYRIDCAFFLTGNQTNKNTLQILSIQYGSKPDVHDCSDNFQSLYVSLEHIIDDDCIMKLYDMDSRIKALKGLLVLNKPGHGINIACTITSVDDGAKEHNANSLTGTSLFSIIFLSSCLVFTCVLGTGWFAFVYYRRYKQYRIKKQQQNALERSVRKILDRLPIIIFNSKNKNNDFMDDDPMCAICLESFINNEKLRKLACSHYFHIACIDPWVLTHQNCPLCNQNILNEFVPSISARMTTTNNELNNRESESIDLPVVINSPITASRNSYL